MPAIQNAATRSLDVALEEVAECEAWLREAGLAIAATYAHEASAYLRLAMVFAITRMVRDCDAAQCADGSEALITEGGVAVGFHLAIDNCGYGSLRPSRKDAAAIGEPRDAAHVRDLGWELASSEAARHFAEDPLAAGLLRRALRDSGWIARSCGSRWSTSATGAATILRLMRRGMPALALRPSPGGILDVRVVALLASLGWSPDTRLITVGDGIDGC